MLLTEPLEVAVVIAAHVAEATGPFRTSLPSMLRARATASPSVAELGWSSAQMAMPAPARSRAIITPKTTAACARSLIIRPNMTIEAIGIRMIETTSRMLLHGVGFSNGMGRVRPEEAAAVGPELLDRDLGRDRTHRDRLGTPLQRLRLGGALEGHRHATRYQQYGQHQGQRHQHEDHRPRRIQVEVAQVLVAAQPADHRQHHGQPAGRRDELEPDDPAKLAEIRQVLLARVVLEVGVGDERADRVEDHGRVGVLVLDPSGVLVAERREGPLAVGVQGQAILRHRTANDRTKSATLKASKATA